MSLEDKLKAKGFKPEASDDGEWKPYIGTYKCSFKTLRVERDEKNACDFIQLELDIVEHIAGDAKRDSKFPAFKKRYYIDFDNPTDDHVENFEKLSKVVFTGTGLELSSTNKQSFIASAGQVIGKTVYIRAYGWTPEKDMSGNEIPEDKRKTNQMWTAQKEAVAEKKRSAESMPF